eukprot:scaffold74533_cov51-Prasinocladus_malaysianus.AAC.1
MAALTLPEVADLPRPEATKCGIENAGSLVLHPIAEDSQDPVMREAHVDGDELVLPPLSTSVFVEIR